jgi:hypothetical protein
MYAHPSHTLSLFFILENIIKQEVLGRTNLLIFIYLKSLNVIYQVAQKMYIDDLHLKTATPLGWFCPTVNN